jgi:hypothetical protein
MTHDLNISSTTDDLLPVNDNLLLFLQPLHNTDRNLEHIRHDIRRCECKPLCERNIRDSLRLVYLNEREILSIRGILDVMP